MRVYDEAFFAPPPNTSRFHTLQVPEEEALLFSTRPRPLRPVGVHQDVNSSNTYLTYVATYKETISPSHDGEMRGARPGVIVRTCKLHYYPHDKSCRVVDPRWDEEDDHLDREGLPRR